MKTKINKISLILGASLILLFGCSKNFLDTNQTAVRTVADFYKTDADATGAIMSCYNMLRCINGSIWTSLWLTKETMSDDIYTGGENAGDQPNYQEINKFTFTSSNTFVTNIYRYGYMIIYRANMIINNMKGSDGTTATLTDYQKLVIAEAKAIRGYMYAELVSLYGPIPLVLAELAPSEYAQPNSTIPKLYEQIEKDLQDGIDGLPTKVTMVSKGSDLARFSKGTAQAFLGKTLLYEKKYAAAATVLNALAGDASYGLYTLPELGGDYTQIFRKSTEFGKESVFEVSYSSDRVNSWADAFGDLWNDPSRTNPSNTVWQLCGPRGDQGFVGGSLNINGGWGFGYPTYSLWNAFKAAGDSVRVHANILTEATLKAAGGSMRKTATSYMWGCPGLVRLKYTTWSDETDGTGGRVPDLNYGTNLRVMRFADVLLMAAEANLMAGDATTASTQVNLVRTRVNLAPIGTVTMDDIKLERRLELAFEGSRYQDLARWDDAKTVLKDQGKLIPTGVFDSNGIMTFNSNASGGFVSPKNNLFPIPFNELNSNPNVKQNPGY